MKIKSILRKVFPGLYLTAGSIKTKIIRFWTQNIIGCERKVYYGKRNPDKKILLIRIQGPALFEICIWVLEYIRYAEKKHMVPIVDMMSFSNPYYKKGIDPKRNIWEYLFEIGGGGIRSNLLLKVGMFI